MRSRKLQIGFAILAVFWLSGGTDCTMSGTSGGGSEDESSRGGGLTVVISSGRLVDAPVQGVSYSSAAIAGVTGANGEYEFQQGHGVRFFIGDIPIGEAVSGKALLTLLDLVANGDIDTPAVINRARLLQSLDSDPGDDVISIPATVRQSAVRSNDLIVAAIDSLDYTNETAFVNAASQLVAVLTSSYSFAAVLVDADTARRHLVESLEREGIRLINGKLPASAP
jgi:hypothetical protein